MEREFLVLEAHREGYAIDQLGTTMTAGELIRFLSDYDEETPVCLSHDRGFTYGTIRADMFRTEDAEDDE